MANFRTKLTPQKYMYNCNHLHLVRSPEALKSQFQKHVGHLVYMKGLRQRSAYGEYLNSRYRIIKMKIWSQITSLSFTASQASFSTKTISMLTEFRPSNSTRAILASDVTRFVSLFSLLRAITCITEKKRSRMMKRLTELCIVSYSMQSYSAGT